MFFYVPEILIQNQTFSKVIKSVWFFKKIQLTTKNSEKLPSRYN